MFQQHPVGLAPVSFAVQALLMQTITAPQAVFNAVLELTYQPLVQALVRFIHALQVQAIWTLTPPHNAFNALLADTLLQTSLQLALSVHRAPLITTAILPPFVNSAVEALKFLLRVQLVLVPFILALLEQLMTTTTVPLHV